MAIETWALRQLSNNILAWDLGPAANLVAQATSSTGWTVSKTAAGNYAPLSNSNEIAGTFSTTIVPTSTAPTVQGAASITNFSPPPIIWNNECISTLYPFNAYFPSGTWTFNFPVIAVSVGGTQDGNITMRVFKAQRSGASSWANVTELTTAMLTGTTVTNLATTAAQTSTVTWSAPDFFLNNEFLICKIGWQISGAASTNGSDILLRYGAGCTMTSPSFRKRAYNIN